MTQAFPLQWPEGWPRTQDYNRKHGKFSTGRHTMGGGQRSLTIADAVTRLLDELGRLGVAHGDAIISTNLALTLDGRPRSGQPEPSDPGVAVYWKIGRQPMRVMAVDIYYRVADNIAAVAATLDAMRAIERHGGAQILERAFTGFTALPPPDRQWWDVLGVARDASPEEIKARHRLLASEAHPDRGGTHDRMAEINRARDKGLAERTIA